MGKRDFEDSAEWAFDADGNPYVPYQRKPHEWKVLEIAKLFQKEPPALDFVISGLLVGTVGSIVAPGSVGKSFFALQTAIAVASASQSFDLLRLGEVKKGRVLVLAAEDPEQVIWHRMHAIGRHLPESVRKDVIENMVIVPCLGDGIDITDPRWEEDLRQLFERTKPRLVFIDTLTRVHSKDENAAMDAKEIMQILEALANEFGCAVVFLHHVSKAAALGGLVELQQAARGSSVFVDNSRWQSFLAVMSSEEAKVAGISDTDRRRYVRWNTPKQNYGPPRPDQWFVRGEGGILMAKGAEHINVDEKPAKSSGKRKKMVY